MKPTLVRTAVSGGALALTLGVAAPALACVTSDAPGTMSGVVTTDRSRSFDPSSDQKSGKAKHEPQQSLTLADLQAKVDAKLASWITWLEKVGTKVSDSSRLTEDQKANLQAKIDARVAELQTAREAVAAATTKAEVKAALKDLGFGRHWFGDHRKHHGDHRSHHGADPARWHHGSRDQGSTRTVSWSWGGGHSRSDHSRSDRGGSDHGRHGGGGGYGFGHR